MSGPSIDAPSEIRSSAQLAFVATLLDPRLRRGANFPVERRSSRSPTMFAILSLLALGVLAGESRLPDRVDLADGTKVEGRVVYEDAQTIVVRTGTREREIARSDVKKMVSRAANEREAITRWIELGPVDYRGMLDLAAFCKRNDLLEEMRLMAWQVVLSEPSNAEARELLGHEATKTGWLVREGARKIDSEKYLKSHAAWNDAIELDTAHFRLRTNAAMRDAIAIAFDLECLYQAFFAVFGEQLKLRQVVEPLNANVHADPKSYPGITTGRNAYSTAQTRTLEVNGASGVDIGLLMHEATHLLIYSTADGTRAATGAIPAWLDEGLAEYMSKTIDGGPGRLELMKGALWRAHFQRQAREKDPYDLSRLLNFDSADFLASANSELKYAEAYTLVHFGLHADGEKYRSRFFDFVRGAYHGQASQTHFKDALGMEGPVLQRAWDAYVKKVAGN